MANESERISRIESILREQGYGDALDAPFAEAQPGTLADLVSALNAADPAPTPVPVLEPAPIAPQADTIESATA